MSNVFTITPTPPTSIKLQPGEVGKLSFTITSQAAPDATHDVVLAALLVGADGQGKEANWLVVEPRKILRMPGGKTETVTIAVRPTAASPRGENTIKLVIADNDRPNDLYGESSAVTCEVRSPDGAPPPAQKKLPWWLIPALVGGLVVVGGGALLIWKLMGDGTGGLNEPCRSDGADACDAGLQCAAGTQKCLRAGGAKCEPAKADQCASNECVSTLKVCAVPLGSTCNPADKDLMPCLKDTVCDPAKKTCLGNAGASCTGDADCATDKCTDNKCAIKAPPLKPGDPCTSTCPEPLQCSTTTKRCVEQIGRPCSNNNQCAMGLCEQDVCSKPELLRDCTLDGICGPDQRCLEVQPGILRCKWRAGHACTGNGDCSSQWCNQGICSRDDGRCVNQNDCAPSSVCNIAKQQCLKPSGQACTKDAECNSNFCSVNRCTPLNLAAGKVATQSTTVLQGIAARAVDGKTDGNWEHGSVTHTALEAQPWWQVDLGAVADIDKVVLYNRTDCCAERLSNFDVLLSNDGSTWRPVASWEGTAPAVRSFPIRATGRFVRVRLRGTNSLSLAEVEVFTP